MTIERNSGIGASESAAACGVSKYETPLHVYLRKIGEIGEAEDNRAMRLGRAFEAAIVTEFQLETGIIVAEYPVPTKRYEPAPWIYATPDAILETGDLLEVKTTGYESARNLGDEMTDDLPVEWLMQAQQQMLVFDVPRVHFAVLVAGRTLKRYLVERDRDLQQSIIDCETELWERIQRRDPPEPDYRHEATHNLIRRLNRVGTADTVDLGDDTGDLIDHRARLRNSIKEIERELATVEGQIEFRIGTAAAAKAGGWSVTRVDISEGEVPGYHRKACHYFRYSKAKGIE